MIMYLFHFQLNLDVDENIVTLGQIQDAYTFLKSSSEVVRTPTLSHVQSLFRDNTGTKAQIDICKVDLFLKMENMQNTSKTISNINHIFSISFLSTGI